MLCWVVLQYRLYCSSFLLRHNWLFLHISYAKMNTAFEWTLIRSFLAAFEHGSLLSAAKALRLTQPTLGRRIAELESQLCTTLFERTGRGLLPTAMALHLADSARAMEAAAQQLTRQAVGAQSKRAGPVRISARQPIACMLLPPPSGANAPGAARDHGRVGGEQCVEQFAQARGR